MWRLLTLSATLFLTTIIVAPAPASVGCGHLGDPLGRGAAPLDYDSYRLPPNVASRAERSM